jgi:fibronectin type 3 domain-containing protein
MMRDSMTLGSHHNSSRTWRSDLTSGAHVRGRRRSRALQNAILVIAASLAPSLFQLATGGLPPAAAATPLNVFVGYMDTHSVPVSSKQPSPWPYTDPTSYAGSPCPKYPNDTTCWDASAVRLDNPGSTDATGLHVVVDIGGSTYDLWGSSLTVKAHGMLVLTETGSQNSTNFDGSDYPPNAYNGGNTASCANSGAIPTVKITIAGATTTYVDSGQVLNGGGVDSGHCLNGAFVSGRMDESHPWAQVGSSTPSAPTAPQSLAATAGSGSVSLTWAAPTSDGGAGITGYDVYRGTSAGAESATPVGTGVTGTSFTDTGLANGATYYYTVAAVNAVGFSPQSNEAFATPTVVQATVPSAPQGLTAAGGNSSVKLSWTAPGSNGGAAITGYDVYRGTSAGAESATPVATGVSGTSFTDTGLANGTTYYYTIAAVNAVGVSAQSGEAPATPQPTVPSAPLAVTAAGGNTTVSLSWSVPASDGGAAITGYDVYRGTSPGAESATPVATSVTGTSFTDTGLANGTTYYYTVAAVNAVGLSAQSGEAPATPQAAPQAAYVRRVGSATASTAKTTITVPVGAPGVTAGHTLIVSMLLSSTSISGAITAKDTAGNTYLLARDTNDGSAGDRSVILVATGVKALAAGASITLTYPSSAETHVSVDEFSGVTGIDLAAGATGTGTAFNSGTTPTTSQPSEILIGSIGTESGTTPTWATGWTTLPPLAVSTDYLDTAYRFVTTTGTYAATGTSGGQWMASIITLKTS